ncbi:hypothetical protein PWF76_09455 [Streptococcus suis]|nr:hypothetical protein [Streptococcus suis]MDE1692907.1 hypothetical protein [Streptococcus suis]MDE3734578.1 hypothetical protein [Streptococcus suis]
MSRREQVILTNMCMITDGQQVLVQDRKSDRIFPIGTAGVDSVVKLRD